MPRGAWRRPGGREPTACDTPGDRPGRRPTTPPHTEPRDAVPAHKAYAFYATSDAYAVAVLVFVRLLRQTGIREDSDIVVLHLGVSRYLIEKLRSLGARTRRVPRLPAARGRYYRHCLTKLRVLALEEYERVVYVDADAMPLGNLDPLFEMDFPEPIAAPRAYWLPPPWWGTHLLVVKPSGELWERVRRHFPDAARRLLYDMDIVNAEFRGELATLPLDTVCLNSEWEDARRAGFFPDPDEARRRVRVVHFTALGKPWSHPPDAVRRLRPHAHPFFHDLWALWWRTRDELFADSSGWVRLRFAVSKWLARGAGGHQAARDRARMAAVPRA